VTKPLAVAPDIERITVDYLTATLAARSQDVTVGVNVPTTWTTATKAHVQVALDGTPVVAYPVMARPTVRVTAWHASTTTAKALAALCEGLLLSHPGTPAVAGFLAGTGVFPAKDPATGAQLASITVRAKALYAAI